MTATSETISHPDAVNDLGSHVIDALTTAGYPVRDRFGNGYDVCGSTENHAPLHVIVVDAREGTLRGMGGWRQMNAQRLAPYTEVLRDAGLAAELLLEVEEPHGPLALVVARDADTVQAAIAYSQAAQNGGK